MMRDAYGLTITTANPATPERFDVYVSEFLAYGPRLRIIFQAADEDPGCALLNAHAAGTHMALEAASGFRHARPYLDRALKAKAGATRREQLYVEAVDCWWQGDYARAADTMAAIVERWPSDLAAAKWAQYHYFNLGHHEPMVHLARLVVDAHPDLAYAHGMLAFALEQTHALEQAEEVGRHAVALERVEPWAHHAVAHAMGTLGRPEEGVAWLEGLADSWADRGVFIREHNFWHLALFYLDLESPAKALAVFDKRLWGEMPEFGQEQIGAVSALWRLELQGVDVGERWSPVVAKVAEREFEHVLPFHDMHYAFALARGGRDASLRAFLGSMGEAAQGAPAMNRSVWQDVAVPLAHGIAAFARGDHHTAHRHMAPAIGGLQRIGGSHAQRDLFEQAWIDVLLETGREAEAMAKLKERHQLWPHVPSINRKLKAALDRAARSGQQPVQKPRASVG